MPLWKRAISRTVPSRVAVCTALADGLGIIDSKQVCTVVTCRLGRQHDASTSHGICKGGIHILVTAFGISIMTQVKSEILACKYITEAQRFAILVKTLPVTGNTMVFVTAVQELLHGCTRGASRNRRALRQMEADNSIFVMLCESGLAELPG